MKKPRIPISKLWPGFKINMVGGVVMTVTAKPVKQQDGRWLVQNDLNGQTYGDNHLTFPHPDEYTAETETKRAEPQ